MKEFNCRDALLRGDDAAVRKEAWSAGAEDYVSKLDLLPLRRILAGA